MKLEDIGDICQGIPLSRIRIKEGVEQEERLVYSFEKEESKVSLAKNLEDLDQDIPLVEEDMILFNMLSYNAKKARPEDLGKVVPSNYVIIRLDSDRVDPDYLAWYLGQGESFKRELHKLRQGSAVLSLPINEFRKIRLSLPSLEIQRKIGGLNSLRLRRKSLEEERDRLVKDFLVSVNEEVMSDG